MRSGTSLSSVCMNLGGLFIRRRKGANDRLFFRFSFANSLFCSDLIQLSVLFLAVHSATVV